MRATRCWSLPKMFAHEIVQDLSEIQPRWLRVAAACRYSGLPRSSLYRLLSEGVIQSASLCSPNKKRGVRIIDRLSLDALLSKLTNRPKEPPAKLTRRKNVKGTARAATAKLHQPS
jgi:hypothetical protein